MGASPLHRSFADRGLSHPSFAMHGTASTIQLALIALHVAAALFHHFIRRDTVLQTMMTASPNRAAAAETPDV